jgi:hypothetical protein
MRRSALQGASPQSFSRLLEHVVKEPFQICAKLSQADEIPCRETTQEIEGQKDEHENSGDTLVDSVIKEEIVHLRASLS